MKTLSPFAVLVLFGFIGLLSHKFGLWFPLGMVAAIIVAIVQKKRAGQASRPAPLDRYRNRHDDRWLCAWIGG